MLAADKAAAAKAKAASLDEVFELSSETESSYSDDVLSRQPSSKQPKRWTKKAPQPATKRPKIEPIVVDDDDESMSEGVLGIGKPKAKRKSGSASAPVPAARTSTSGSESASAPPGGKGKVKMSSWDNVSKVKFEDDDEGADSDASESILAVRTPPKVKSEVVEMGTYSKEFETDDRHEGGAASAPGLADAEPAPSQDGLEDDEEDMIREALAQREVQLGIIRSKVVGIKYCEHTWSGSYLIVVWSNNMVSLSDQGMTLDNEMVNLIREPHNAYDRFALRVDNQRNQQVGHIPKDTVRTISPLIDSGKLRLEGELLSLPRPPESLSNTHCSVSRQNLRPEIDMGPSYRPPRFHASREPERDASRFAQRRRFVERLPGAHEPIRSWFQRCSSSHAAKDACRGSLGETAANRTEARA